MCFCDMKTLTEVFMSGDVGVLGCEFGRGRWLKFGHGNLQELGGSTLGAHLKDQRIRPANRLPEKIICLRNE